MEKLRITFFKLLFITLLCCATICCTDKCKNMVCQNGGTCIDGDCICSCNYTGKNCETVPPSCGLVDTLPITPIIQQEPRWCWLTCGEMIFRHYNIPTVNPYSYQCGIIGSLDQACYYSCVNCANLSGYISDIQNMLSNYPKVACSQTCVGIKSNALNSALAPNAVTEELLNGRPILAGISLDGSENPGHAVLIVAYSYDNIGNLLLYVNDPWPYNALGETPPYMNNNGQFIQEGQYLIPYAFFLQGYNLKWLQTVYGISL